MGFHKSWLQDADADATTLYQTDLYSGADADVAGTELFTDVIDLTVQAGASFDLTFDGNDATDDLILKVYKRVEDSTFVGTEIARNQITISSDGSADIYSFELLAGDRGPGYYRLGLVRSGATTTFDVQIIMKYHRETTSKS